MRKIIYFLFTNLCPHFEEGRGERKTSKKKKKGNKSDFLGEKIYFRFVDGGYLNEANPIMASLP